MKFVVCSADFLPCPPEAQQLFSLADVIAESINHLDPQTLATSYFFGAASVMVWWSAGFVISTAIKVLRKA